MTTTKPVAIPLDGVEFVKELYPRLREDDAAIERYRAALDKLPPITVARGRILVDGFHRWQAHRRENADSIAAVDLGNLSDVEILRESYRRNATHGQQLSKQDKTTAAEHMYRTLPGSDDERYAEIADVLSIKVSVAKKYAAEARAGEQRFKRDAAWDMWLDASLTQTEIGARLDESQQTISGWIQKRESDSSFCEPPESRQHFDVWNFQNATGESSYFGKMPPQVVENLLWLYTEPGSIVMDPFAGGGTTIDVAKIMGRRVWASDRKPSTPTLPIHQHDITTGWPKAAPNKADFILLDPPYWMQAAGRYSDDPEDLGNMTLDDFTAAWTKTIKACKPHLADGGRLAYIVSPAGTKDHSVVDLALIMCDAARYAGLEVERRVIVPYQTQQATGQQVEWAREQRKLLKLYRDLVVMRP
jgi:DNA modification methylase